MLIMNGGNNQSICIRERKKAKCKSGIKENARGASMEGVNNTPLSLHDDTILVFFFGILFLAGLFFLEFAFVVACWDV